MVPGTTPTHSWTFPFSTSFITNCSVSYKEKSETFLIKRMNELTLKDNIVSVQLTQEETLDFMNRKKPIEVQLKYKIGNEVMATPPYEIPIERIFDTEVF